VRLQRPLLAILITFLLFGLCADSLAAQSLGQQVSGQPYNGGGMGQSSGQSVGIGQGTGQAGGLPQNTNPTGAPSFPGTGPSTGGAATQLLATGSDIPQAGGNAQIGNGDLLDVMVFDTPELSGRFRVNNQGNIDLPLVGLLHVSGLTAIEASAAVAAKYQGEQVLLQPQVSVFISEYGSRMGVTITGEVRSPGIFPLLGPRNLTDILAQAGGLGESASKTVSIVHRNDPAHILTIQLNVGRPTPASVAAANIPIVPGDTIYVARSGVVYVVGDLTRPGGYQVEHNNRLTLLEAVALAGGPTQTSKLNDARLIRRSETGREEIKIDLKRILYGGGPDVLMADGDILYVPISQRKVYTQLGINAVISAATSYAIFKISTL
jgi:polysaccharide export outer membrane protein